MFDDETMYWDSVVQAQIKSLESNTSVTELMLFMCSYFVIFITDIWCGETQAPDFFNIGARMKLRSGRNIVDTTGEKELIIRSYLQQIFPLRLFSLTLNINTQCVAVYIYILYSLFTWYKYVRLLLI
jgi:hypothetical protein